jgi:hypothetical protein
MKKHLLGILLIMPCLMAIIAMPQTQDAASLEEKAKAAQAAYETKDYARALVLVQAAISTPAFERLPASDRQNFFYNESCIYALLGQKAMAIKALRTAVSLGYSNVAQIAIDPDLDAIRNDAEFKSWLSELKAKFGLKPLEWVHDKNESPFPLHMDSANNPKLKTLRTEFGIDAVVANARDDYEQLRRIADWTSNRWEHSATQNASNNDPLTILREAKAGGQFICMNYAVVLGGTASALGLPSRLLGLLPKETETRHDAHSVAEVWLSSRGKWVLADGQWGQVAEVDGVPLNAIELQDALVKDKTIQCSKPVSCRPWLGFIQQYLYFFKITRDERWFENFKADQLVLMPVGATAPKSMNGNTNVFAGARYTSNPDIFYAAPPK